MQQLDLFDEDKIFYLYSEINNIKNSTDRQRRAIFSILTEMQDELIDLRKKMENYKNDETLPRMS